MTYHCNDGTIHDNISNILNVLPISSLLQNMCFRAPQFDIITFEVSLIEHKMREVLDFHIISINTAVIILGLRTQRLNALTSLFGNLPKIACREKTKSNIWAIILPVLYQNTYSGKHDAKVKCSLRRTHLLYHRRI